MIMKRQEKETKRETEKSEKKRQLRGKLKNQLSLKVMKVACGAKDLKSKMPKMLTLRTIAVIMKDNKDVKTKELLRLVSLEVKT